MTSHSRPPLGHVRDDLDQVLHGPIQAIEAPDHEGVAVPPVGLWHLAEQPAVEADYVAAMSFVTDYHAPGQPVPAVFPEVADLALGGREDLLYLARLGDGLWWQKAPGRP